MLPADHQQRRGAAVVPAGEGTIPGRPPCWNALRVLKPLSVVHRGLAPGAWTGAGGFRRRHAAPEAARPLQADNGNQLSAASRPAPARRFEATALRIAIESRGQRVPALDVAFERLRED